MRCKSFKCTCICISGPVTPIQIRLLLSQLKMTKGLVRMPQRGIDRQKGSGEMLVCVAGNLNRSGDKNPNIVRRQLNA